MKGKSIAIGLLVSAAFLGAVVSGEEAAAKKGKSGGWFHYAVTFTCGVNGDSPSVVQGTYATSANAHNAGETDAVLRKSVALSFPPGASTPGAVSDVMEQPLPAGTALHVTCAEIPSAFTFAVPPAASDYVEGVLVLESDVPLNVSAVYSAGEDVATLQVVHVPERLVQRSSSENVAVCHAPPGNPENAHTIVVGASAVPAHVGHGDTLGVCPVR